MPQLFKRRYYNINKFLLTTIGQWPYQTRLRKRVILAIVVFLAASTIIPQIIAVVKFGDDPEVVLESISPFVIDFICATKLANVVINSDKMLELADRMQLDWEYLVDQPEINVLHDYAAIAKKFTIAYAAGVYGVTVIFLTQPALPQFLSYLELAQPQPKKFAYPVDYFGIDFETYYPYMLAHSYVAVGAILTVFVAADTMFMVHCQHACGMFVVVGCQLKRTGTDLPENYDFRSRQSEDLAFRRLAACIKKHEEVIEFANLLESSYTWCFFSFVGFNMIMISVTGLQTVAKLDDNAEEAVRYAAFTFAQLGHLFVQSFFSQRLMDHSKIVRDYMYQAEWYKTSLRAQKLVNFVTMRTAVPCQLTAGNFMVMSLENFTAIVKTSMSYFTLLRSMQ